MRLRKSAPPALPAFNLDAPLLKLSPYDSFRLRDAVLGVLATGGIGAGKTTALRSLARAYLAAGMGGIVMCAKPGEAQRWLQLCHETGRAASAVVMNGRNDVKLNFLDHDIARLGLPGVESAIECLMQVVEAADMATTTPGSDGEKFWADMKRQVLRIVVPLLYSAYGRVTIPDIIRCVRSAPMSRDEASSPNWQANSFLFRSLQVAAQRLGDSDPFVNRIADYWFSEWATMPEKTRGNVAVSLTTVLDRFTSGWLKDTFASGSNCPPELTFQGVVIILDMPALTMNEDGIIAQVIYKFMWQRAVLARGGLDLAQRIRPVFSWSDEGHMFLQPGDATFLSMSRESLACPVLISQSLPTFDARMPGQNARDRVRQLLGNFATRLWLNNACHETNAWASATIGKAIQRRANYSEGQSQGGSYSSGKQIGENQGHSRSYQQQLVRGSFFNPMTELHGSDSEGTSWGRNYSDGSNWGSNSSHGYSEQMDDLITPGFFSRSLKTGGPANGNRVSGIWFQAGRVFSNGENFLLTEFQQ